MPRPKSILVRIEVDEARRSHNCQHNAAHRLTPGEKRLKVWKDRSPEHYCVDCALSIINRDIAKLQQLARLLES
jgi:hypothetical protein